MTRVAQPSDAEILRGWVGQSSSFAGILDLIASTGTSAFLVGGAVRTRLLHDRPRPRDVDVVVEERAADVLQHLATFMPVILRQQDAGTVLLPDGSTADIFSPQSFREGCESAEEMLRWFDLSVNAIGIPLDPSRTRLDPVGGAADARARCVTLTERRWAASSDRDTVHLTMRLVELANRVPDLMVRSIAPLERCGSLLEHLPDWEPVQECHGLSRGEAIALLRSLVASHPRLSVDNGR